MYILCLCISRNAFCKTFHFGSLGSSKGMCPCFISLFLLCSLILIDFQDSNVMSFGFHSGIQH